MSKPSRRRQKARPNCRQRPVRASVPRRVMPRPSGIATGSLGRAAGQGATGWRGTSSSRQPAQASTAARRASGTSRPQPGGRTARRNWTGGNGHAWAEEYVACARAPGRLRTVACAHAARAPTWSANSSAKEGAGRPRLRAPPAKAALSVPCWPQVTTAPAFRGCRVPYCTRCWPWLSVQACRWKAGYPPIAVGAPLPDRMRFRVSSGRRDNWTEIFSERVQRRSGRGGRKGNCAVRVSRPAHDCPRYGTPEIAPQRHRPCRGSGQHGIEVHADMPAVMANLHDDPASQLEFAGTEALCEELVQDGAGFPKSKQLRRPAHQSRTARSTWASQPHYASWAESLKRAKGGQHLTREPDRRRIGVLAHGIDAAHCGRCANDSPRLYRSKDV